MRGGLEMADVLQRHEASFMATHRHALRRGDYKIWRDIVDCRTARKGGHESVCRDCGVIERSYNSCRNRHCPKCLSSSRAEWVDRRRADLLPVPYFHVVFTLPDQLSALALQNRAAIYDLLFRASSQAMLELGADRRRLGARLGFLTILHTWGQRLNYHPHVHCVVPNGGFSQDGKRWVTGKATFFIHTRPLGDRYRNLFSTGLQELRDSGELDLHGKIAALRDDSKWRQFVRELRRLQWVVYAKPPFGSSERVVKYLSRYTHRVAISNQRLLRQDDDTVTFQFKDYRDGHQSKELTLAGHEFIRRFLTHTMPKQFVRIRYFGWMANSNRAAALERARLLLAIPDDIRSSIAGSQRAGIRPCPHCETGVLTLVMVYQPQSLPYGFDTS